MNRLGPVRIVIDASRCDGHAICVLRCPERITLDEWGYAHVDDTPTETAASSARAERAALACPAGALTLIDHASGRTLATVRSRPGRTSRAR